MKLRFLAPILSCLVMAGCSEGQKAFDDGSEGKKGASASDEQSAFGDLYIGDTVESAGSDEESSGSVDSSVMDDLRDERLKKMSANLLAKLDVDSSGSLTLEEFLALPEALAAKFGRSPPSASMLERIKTKLTDEFNQSAGDDSLLSSDELTALLAAQAPRVAHFRGKHRRGPGGPGGMMPPPPHGPEQNWDSVLAKYDSDADGVLNQAEFEAFMKDRQPKGLRRHIGPPSPRGGGQGQNG